jgi:hypothetical protein
MYLQEYVEARMVRTDQRRVEDVGARGGKPGSNPRVWRSLDVDKYADVDPAERGNVTPIARMTVATGGAARQGGGALHDEPLSEISVRGV